MFYTIYKITNNITKQEYIGQHQTSNLDDGYLGSGVRLKNSIRKYGKENFSKEILFIFDNFEDMNNKEKELVDESWIRASNSLNTILGGMENNPKGTVIVKEGDRCFRIPAEIYKSTFYTTPTTGTVKVYDSNNSFVRVATEEYRENKHKYRHFSKGKVSVVDKTTGQAKSILLSDYDPIKYSKVFGGIVVKKEGKKQYVTKQEFKDFKLEGVHKGKVTVVEKETGKRKHVTKEEYNFNREKYLQNTEGYVTGINLSTLEKERLTVEEARQRKEEFKFSTAGTLTVFCIETNMFKQIDKNLYNPSFHRLAQDKMFVCWDKEGKEKFRYWGSKKEFITQYRVPEIMWSSICKEEVLKKLRKQTSWQFDGCYCKMIEWKKIKNVSRIWKTMRV